MCIERNRYLLFWTARGLQIVLPNPTTPALTCEVGLVHQTITRWFRDACSIQVVRDTVGKTDCGSRKLDLSAPPRDGRSSASAHAD